MAARVLIPILIVLLVAQSIEAQQAVNEGTRPRFRRSFVAPCIENVTVRVPSVPVESDGPIARRRIDECRAFLASRS